MLAKDYEVAVESEPSGEFEQCLRHMQAQSDRIASANRRLASLAVRLLGMPEAVEKDSSGVNVSAKGLIFEFRATGNVMDNRLKELVGLIEQLERL